MQNTIHRNSHTATTRAQRTNHSQNTEQAGSNPSPAEPSDTFTSSQNDSSAGLYDPSMFQRRFSYGAGRFDPANTRAAHGVYRHHGNQQMDLSDRRQVGRLISRSPQNDNLSDRVTNDDDNRCGGAAILNGMLLDGDHEHNARAIRETMGDDLTPQQRQSLDHMEAGRLSPNEAAQLQEAIYDHANGLNGRDDHGLNRDDMRRTVAELRQHGAFQNTRELNFRSERFFRSLASCSRATTPVTAVFGRQLRRLELFWSPGLGDLWGTNFTAFFGHLKSIE